MRYSFELPLHGLKLIGLIEPLSGWTAAENKPASCKSMKTFPAWKVEALKPT
jgi:hypothetical protein